MTTTERKHCRRRPSWRSATSTRRSRARRSCKGIDLTVRQGETHALMGPNGSGKSTLANVLMGRPGYVVTGGEVRFKGEDILALTPDQRASAGAVPRDAVPGRRCPA